MDNALSVPSFATQYLFLNLKREYLLRDLLDECLRNSNHSVIFENGELFLSVLDKITDPENKQKIAILEVLIKNIVVKGNISVTELKFIKEEVLRCSRNGNLNKIRTLCGKYKLFEMTQVRDKNIEVIQLWEEKEDMIKVCHKSLRQSSLSSPFTTYSEEALKDWNPLHVAIFFGHLNIVKFFCDEMRINVRAAIKQPGTKKNYNSEYQQNQYLCSSFLLDCFYHQNKDSSMLLYFWDHHPYLFTERDIKSVVISLVKSN